jgi:hypothetical protein
LHTRLQKLTCIQKTKVIPEASPCYKLGH